MLERDGEPALDVRAHLRAGTEIEAAAARALDRPRVHRGDHGASREGDRDPGTEPKALRPHGGDGEREERVRLRLRDPHAVKALVLETRRVVAGVLERE